MASPTTSDLKAGVFAGKSFRYQSPNDQGQRVVTTVGPATASAVNRA